LMYYRAISLGKVWYELGDKFSSGNDAHTD